VLQKVNDLQVRYAGSLAAQPLTTSERKLAFDLLDRDGNQTFSSLRRALKLNKNSKFNLEMGDEKLLRGNNTNKTMLSVFGERWDHLSEDEKKQIVELWRTIESEETLIRRAMRDWGLDEIAAQQLAVANPEDGYCPLSRKAIERLLPLMFEGMSFKDAKRRQYGSHSSGGQVLDQLPPLHVHRGLKGTAHSDIFASNFYLAPTCDQAIKRALTEMRKVVNAIVREHGKPHEVHIELARELKKTRKERKRLTGKNRQRKRDRDAAKADLLRNCGIQNPSHADMEKALLLAECCGICPYSGRSISLEDLFGELQEFDVEHIIPLSRYPDDSFQNKTLCWRRENHAMKHNKLPFEAYGADPIRWEEMQLRVKAWKPANPAKLERFVIRSENELEDFIARRMNDTRYASILTSRLLELFYGGRDVETHSGPRQVIFTSSGSVTATLRRKWQLERILHEAIRSNSGQSTGNPRTDYRHHAIDAVTIALTRQAVVQSLRRSASINPHSQLEVRAFHNITSPWPQFVESIRPQIEALVVSHRPEHKMGGELHDETNYGKPYVSNGKTIVHIRKPVSGLTAKDIESIVDPVVRSAVQQKAERLNGDLSKCESANDWPVLLSGNGKSIPIKRVRISKVLDVRPVGERERQRFVATTNNHHMAIFELLRNEQDVKWEGIPVSLYEVMERKRKQQALIDRSHPNGDPWKFKFSLMGGDTLELHRKCDHEKNICKPEIYRIRAIAANGQLIWMAIGRTAWKPTISYPPIRFVRFSGWALTDGVERYAIQSRKVSITNPARTIVDCFRYRNKIGIAIAMEGLRTCIRQKQCTPDELWQYGKKARIWTIMRPYVETVVADAT
jgi:CRISPR-associated endonuclease Csn1